MKKMKKIMSLALALVLAMAMGITAFAEAQMEDTKKGGNGEIHISNATIGAEYTVYKVFDATIAEDKIAYRWPANQTWAENDFFAKDDAGNISAKVAAFAKDNETDDLLKDKLSDEAIEWIKSNGVEIKTVKATDQSLTFTGLEYGYYYVTSSVKGNGTITITNINPTAEIIDKNQNPGWNEDDKSIILDPGTDEEIKTDVSDNAFGDVVTFEIAVNATNYFNDEQIETYYVYDTLGTGLDYNKESVVVTVGEKTITAEQDYIIAWDDSSNKFTIKIPWVNETNDTEGTKIESKYDANTTIKVRYTATVNNNAVIAGEGNLNKAKFDFKTTKDDPENPDDPKPWHESEEKTTTTYTYALGIQKTDENGEALAGAKFTIAGIGGVKSGDGIYNFTSDKTANEYTTEFETGTAGEAKGQLIIKGVTVGEYEVTEAVAPNGYNMLTGPVTVTAQRDGETTKTNTTTHIFSYDENGNLVKSEEVSENTETYTFPVNVTAIAIVNKTGSLLPSTGGIGTTIFYVVGAVLVIGAGVLLVTKRRMRAQ